MHINVLLLISVAGSECLRMVPLGQKRGGPVFWGNPKVIVAATTIINNHNGGIQLQDSFLSHRYIIEGLICTSHIVMLMGKK